MVYNVTITLDTSEGGLRGWLQQLPEKSNLTYEPLPVGDILFYVENKPTLLIERKEVSDFRGSVADGRFREQRSRMIELRKQMPGLVIAYLIEGDFSTLNYRQHSRLPQNFLENLVNDLGPKYNICVVRSKHLLDTLRLIGRIENIYHENGPITYILDKDDPARTYTIGKKRGLDRNQFAACALSLIPGVTRDAALSITAVYPTLRALTQAFETASTNTERDQLLFGIGYNNLKIGKTMAKRICDWIMDISDDSSDSDECVQEVVMLSDSNSVSENELMLSESDSMSESELPPKFRKPMITSSPSHGEKLVVYSDSHEEDDNISDSSDGRAWYLEKRKAVTRKFAQPSRNRQRRRSASPKRIKRR